jgi:hypothetical protein
MVTEGSVVKAAPETPSTGSVVNLRDAGNPVMLKLELVAVNVPVEVTDVAVKVKPVP